MEQENENLMIRFFENELTQDEIRTFNSKYQNDPEFRQMINEQTRLVAAIKTTSDLNQFKSGTGLKKKKIRKNSGKNVLKKSIYYQIAAVIVPLCILGSLFFYYKSMDLSADSYVAKGIDMTTRSETQMGFSTQIGARSEQIQQEIDNAILESLDQLTSVEETYFFGVKSIRENRYNEAIFAFRRVIGSAEKNHSEDSEWLLALCYIKTGESEKAKSALEKISASKKHKHKNESLKLLKKLDW